MFNLSLCKIFEVTTSVLAWLIQSIIPKAYHSLHIQDGCTLIDVLLCSNGASCKLHIKCPLKLLNMVFDIAIHGCDLHKLSGIYLAQSLNVDRSSIFIYSMMSMGIIFQDFIDFLEFKFLA